MENILDNIRPEIIKHLVNSFNTKDFIADILYSGGIHNSRYKNAIGMFAWNKPYCEISKMESIFDDVMVFSANINAWDFPLVYDTRTQIVFLLMGENNLNQKRKQKVSEEHPPHYSKILCEINQPYSNQVPLFNEETEKPSNILCKFTSDDRIKNLPQDIKLVIVSSQKISGELLKVTGALFDKNLLLINDEVDWSSYIDNDYSSSNIVDENTEKRIIETNANTLIMNTMKESLISIKQNIDQNTINEI